MRGTTGALYLPLSLFHPAQAFYSVEVIVMRAGSYSILVFRVSVALLLGIVAGPVLAQDPPGRIGRLNYSEGTVSFAPANDDEFADADLNRPLVVGDKLWTDKGVRAELQVGSAAVRMDGRTHLTVLALDDQSTQISVTQGTVYVRVRSLPEGENFEVDTPNLAWRASYPGDYRIDVDAQRGTTRVTIHSGTGAVYGEKAQALPMGGGQQIIFKGRALAQVDSHEQPPQDNFDRWAAERNRREDQSVAARYVPREVVGYQLLDTAGQWQNDANLGVVWFPQNAKDNWAPYRNGRWEWIAPWGWTWIDEAPWAFITSHYGRWALVGTKWGWVPGRMGLRPIYAPALVAFVGNGNAPLSVGGKQTVAWFPLAPGEAWQPTYKATPLYISSINANMPPVQSAGSSAYQRKPEALTAIAIEDFQRGKPAKGSWLRVAANTLTNAQVIAPPAMPERAKTMVARLPAPNPEIKPAINRGMTAAQQLEAQRQADAAKQAEAQRQAAEAQKLADIQKQGQKLAEAQAQRERERLAREELAQRQQREELAQRQQREQLAKAEQARRADEAKAAQERQRAATEQAKAVELQQRAAEQQKLAQQRAAEQQKLAQQQRAAEQERVADRQKLAQQQRFGEQERGTDRQKLAQQPRAADQARVAREQRAAELAQRRAEQQAKAREQRELREASAKRAEQTRREQVAKREQAKREQVAALLRDREAKREQAAKARADRELQAKRAQETKRLALAAKKEDEARRIAHAQQVEQARRAAEREAQVLQAQRTQREEAIRKVAEDKERERTQREAWQRQQQQLAEQWKRDQQAYEEQQRRVQQRTRPDLRRAQPAAEPEVWQRGIPILNPGRTS
jgi:hypothetical protein